MEALGPKLCITADTSPTVLQAPLTIKNCHVAVLTVATAQWQKVILFSPFMPFQALKQHPTPSCFQHLKRKEEQEDHLVLPQCWFHQAPTCGCHNILFTYL